MNITRVLRCQENTVLVVDTSKLKDRKYVLYDELGTWPGFSGSAFTIENGKLIDSYSLSRSLKNCLDLNYNQYILKRTFSKCAFSMEYNKITTTITDKK